MTDLQTGNTSGLEAFVSQYSSDFPTLGSSGTDPLFDFAANGTATSAGSVTIGAAGTTSSAVPEPSTYLLLGLGLSSLALIRSRRKSRS